MLGGFGRNHAVACLLTLLTRALAVCALMTAVALVAGASAQDAEQEQNTLELGGEALFYETVSKPLSDALQEISFLVGLPVVGLGLPEIEVSGEFFADDTASFLEYFCGTYNLDWIELNGDILVTDKRARVQVGYEFAEELDAQSFRLQLGRIFKNHSDFPEKLERSGNDFVLMIEAPRMFQAKVAEMFGTDRLAVVDAAPLDEFPAVSTDSAAAERGEGQDAAVGMAELAVARAEADDMVSADLTRIGPPLEEAEVDLTTVETPSLRTDAPRARVEAPRIRVDTRRIAEVSRTAKLGVMRFALRHAWVEDKVLESAGSGGSPVKIAGVAGIFSQLVKAARTAENSGAQPPSALSELTPVAGSASVAGAQGRSASVSAKPSGPGNTTGLPNITMDTRTNALLVYDSLSYREFYKELIRDLDRPLQLVEIEAMVIDVTADRVGDLGISWSAGAGAVSVNFSGGFQIGGDAQLGDIDLIVDNVKFMARLRALNSVGASRVVSQPSLLVMDNHPASIETTNSFYVKVSGSNTAALYPVSTGTRVNVIPHVIDSADASRRRIQMLVSIRDGKVNNTASAQVEGLPQITERNINTQAVVYHGESLLIGGHKYTEDSDSVAGVPLLSSLPLVGMLFSKRAERASEYVRLFLLRPSLVEMSYERVEASEARLESEPLLSGASRRLEPPSSTGRRVRSSTVPARNLLERARAVTGLDLPADTAETVLLRMISAVASANAPLAAVYRAPAPDRAPN